jgi:hypothetical protein
MYSEWLPGPAPAGEKAHNANVVGELKGDGKPPPAMSQRAVLHSVMTTPSTVQVQPSMANGRA